MWSYNQGLLVGLEVLHSRAGDLDALGRARSHAALTLDWFACDDRLWRHPPCFVAVLLRMLALLHSADADGRWLAATDTYLDRVWAQAGSANGWRAAGIGAYGEEAVLDLAGIAQLTALRAMHPGRYAQLC